MNKLNLIDGMPSDPNNAQHLACPRCDSESVELVPFSQLATEDSELRPHSPATDKGQFRGVALSFGLKCHACGLVTTVHLATHHLREGGTKLYMWAYRVAEDGLQEEHWSVKRILSKAERRYREEFYPPNCCKMAYIWDDDGVVMNPISDGSPIMEQGFPLKKYTFQELGDWPGK